MAGYDVHAYDVQSSDGSVERVLGVDSYVQEGPLTTFFRTDAQRGVIDCWSTRVASFRTAEISRIRAVTPAD
ncbi:MAG: hypothetical protein QOI47_388 [Actinomycetota bacterium]|jgi:hypothetical protein|nr:hypothetical protein [Actinomycetota bacterium]